MEDSDLADDSEMSNRTGSILCLSKQTITNIFECFVSILIYISALYLLLLVLNLITQGTINQLYHPVGYISLIILISAPLAVYGSVSGSYLALFGYFILASYHLYALCTYGWLKIKSGEFKLTPGTDPLHQIITISYVVLLLLSSLLATCKIISNVSLVDPGKVIVVDNNPID